MEYEIHKVQALSANIADMGCSFVQLVGIQIRFNPLDANDKRYYKSCILDIREIQNALGSGR